MKSSTKTSLALLSVFIVLCSSVSWLASITAAPTPANDLYVTFEEEADLDHVCFYITMKNEQDSDDSFPSKFLLNRTSIDIAKAETKLWEEQEYEYEVTHCKTCEVEVKNCTINNETKEEKCEPHNASVTDCDECGNWSEERTGYRWEGKQLASTEKDTGKKELRNQFEEIQIKKGETKRYKLCYYFNEIPINPSTGMSGSYGYMYLDVKDKLHYDFENSSCWNTSCCDKKMPVYGWCPHCSSDTEMVLLASNRTDNMGAYINGSLEFFWGNFTVNSTWQIIGYVYYNNETDYALVDPTETYQLEMDVDEGNSTDYGNPWDKNTILVLHLNGTGGHDSSTYGYTASVGDSPASVDGIVGHANYFDGSNDDMNYGDTIDGDFYMTVMLWMKASGTDSGYAITKYASGKKRWYMEHGGSGTGVDFNDNVHGGYYPKITAETVDGTWHHLAFVLNNTNAYAYFDGVLTATDSEANFQGCTNNNSLIVAGSNINYFNGTLDEVRIYNRSLSSDEIMMIYNNTVGTHNVTQFGLEEIRVPQITIYSPKNKTYDITTIDLNWSADQTLDWIAYSLNGTGNVSLFHKEGEYIDSFDISGEISSPCGITQNGTYFWITDADDDEVYQYHIDGTYANNHFDTNSSGNIVPFGITQNGTYFWITDTPTQMVYIYDMDGTPAGNFSTAAESCSPWGITQNGTYFWITDNGTGNTVYKYWMNGTYADSFNTAGENADAKGITQNGTYFWIVDFVDEKVYIYNMDGTYTGRSFSTAAANNEPFGITQNGTYIWITDLYDYAPVVYKYYENEEFFNTTITAEEGSHNVTVCGNSTSGNMNCTTKYFTVDLTNPVISLTFPENNTRYNLTWINITGTASDNNADTIYINDTENFGTNLGNYTNWNFTNTSIEEGWYSLKITANDTGGNEKLVEVHFSIGTWNITFNVTSDEQHQPEKDGVTITCNYTGFSQGGDNTNPYGPYGFPSGDWECTFSLGQYFDITEIFTAGDKTINVTIPRAGGATYQEHEWIEWLYECWYSGECRQTLDRIETMIVYINQTTTQINETINKVWDQFKQTDESVVLNETTISSVVSNTSNITINYSVDVPEKEDYKFLPIRLFYWFLDETNTSCYSQGNYSVAMIEPYCQPLVAHTIGEVNTVLNFTVDMRPSLPSGNYTLVRRIDIDPNDIWINYGHEILGMIEVLEDNTELNVNLEITSKDVEKHEESELASQQPDKMESDGVTGFTIAKLLNPASLSLVISLITLITVVCLVIVKRKQ